jgi:hypothetical protein
MSTFTIPDCLVLRLVEVTSNTRLGYDQEMFIIWDDRLKKFYVYGKRVVTSTYDSQPYIYTFKSSKHVLNFIDLLCFPDRFTVELYNYDNLPRNSNDITFEFLKKCVHSDYEVVAYDDVDFNRKMNNEIVRCVEILQQAVNDFSTY